MTNSLKLKGSHLLLLELKLQYFGHLDGGNPPPSRCRLTLGPQYHLREPEWQDYTRLGSIHNLSHRRQDTEVESVLIHLHIASRLPFHHMNLT